MKKLVFLFAFILIACKESYTELGPCDQYADTKIYIDEFGTITACGNSKVGDTQLINGISYKVVDEEMLRAMVANDEDVTRLATSKIRNMNALFYLKDNFNQDIGNWDTGRVNDMSSMFLGAKSFNQNIGNWKLGNVVTMSSMFYGADAFNQDISVWGDRNINNYGRTCLVKNMSYMFYEATEFDQDISTWDVRNVEICHYFSNRNKNSWTASEKPNFTECP